ERELVRRAADPPLRLKDGDLVDLADREREARRGRGVEGAAPRRRAVNAAEVDRELAVDEDPDVVVADELQGLAAAVLEPVADLAGEAVVVRQVVHVAVREAADLRA